MYMAVCISATWNWNSREYRYSGMMRTDDTFWYAYTERRSYGRQESLEKEDFSGYYWFAVAKRNEYQRRGL